MNRYDYLTRNINCLILRYKDDQYEFHRALSMLLLCFCKNNNEASLTETRNGVLHFRFITESRIETNLTIVPNLLLRRYKINKINKINEKNRRTTEGLILG